MAGLAVGLPNNWQVKTKTWSVKVTCYIPKMNLAMYKAHLLNSKPPYAWQQSPCNFGKVSSRPFCSNTILFQLVQSGILGMLVTFAALVVLFLLHLSMIHLNWLVLCYLVLLCTTSALYESKANFNNGYMPPNNFWINIFCACYFLGHILLNKFFHYHHTRFVNSYLPSLWRFSHF